MPPRARASGATPEFLTSPTVGELLAIEIEAIAAAPPAPENADGDHDGGHGSAAPALTPRGRARQSMLNRAAAELRDHHAASGDAD